MWVCRTTASVPAGGVIASRAADRHEVQRGVEVGTVALGAQLEVALGDGGGEAVVEALGDPERRVDVVPAGVAQRPLVDAQLAGVVEPEQLDAGEVRAAQGPELRGAVLLELPRVDRAV